MWVREHIVSAVAKWLKRQTADAEVYRVQPSEEFPFKQLPSEEFELTAITQHAHMKSHG